MSLFRDIDDDFILDVIGDFEVITFPAETLLLKPGDKNQCVYLLLSGMMEAYFEPTFSPGMGMPILPGECIGEFSAIDGKPVSAFVITTQESRVLHVPSESLWNTLMPIPGIGKNLMVFLTERMRRSNDAALEAFRNQLSLQYLKKELEVARQLQASMLPRRQPMFPERTTVEIAGMMEAASEIGGDLYDAFFIDEQVLFFCIGDVSGHGIPAALFMARIVGLIRISAMSTNRPDHLLERLNNQLCEGNETNMFVTLFCGFLDTRNGHFMYSNAGHCAPLFVSKGGVSRLPIPKGALVGVLPHIQYTANEIVLAKDETVVCYTDGITEAHSAGGEEFSEDRLSATVHQNSCGPLEELLKAVRQEVADFTDSLALSDDCTMLAVRLLH